MWLIAWLKSQTIFVYHTKTPQGCCNTGPKRVATFPFHSCEIYLGQWPVVPPLSPLPLSFVLWIKRVTSKIKMFHFSHPHHSLCVLENKNKYFLLWSQLKSIVYSLVGQQDHTQQPQSTLKQSSLRIPILHNTNSLRCYKITVHWVQQDVKAGNI